MNLTEFRDIAKDHNVIPVWKKFLADSETPLALYRKLAKNRPGTFLSNQQNMAVLGLDTLLSE